ncbi:MAG: response regulator [Burkholderiales bacterium]|nr:response regulator [Burkholderiales bacterium]MDE1927731.1 response regulator [Burkholderiales bacterium]MDE2158184.1 response regulator [Burkholderiales bacterium]MDE2504568.1 response regulator [Burkholderiales bacterium]
MADARHALSARLVPARLSWLGLVGFGLMMALLAVALVQARQFSLLRQSLASGDDYGMLSIFQAETEYLRLRDRWHHELDAQAAPDPQALRRRYAIWLTRVQALHARRARGLLDDDADYRATLERIDAFVADTRAALGERAAQPADRAFLLALQPALEALDRPLHEMSQGASARVARLLEARARTVRAQNQLGLGLTVFLSVLTLAFAAIALRQVRQLRERRIALESLADNLRQARRDAEAASEAKSAFLANMSHEIRTPFHGLMGMLSLLRETGLTPRQIDYLRTATESADHLLALLNDILDMSQLESGRVTLAPTAVELRALLRDVEALMRPQAGAKSLALHIDADPAVPERVLLDATRVKQIVFNLLSNAIKFSDRGAVVLDVRCTPGRRELAFVVSDSGVGMDEATLAHLFSRFMQGDSSRSRRHGGSGLGLEISRNLARLMGGDITVRSKVGAGSVFTFTMPLRMPPAAAAPGAVRPPVGEPMPRLRVLVAEDHPVNRQYIAALLENLGHEAHFSADGEQAVRSAREHAYDLVLMDLHMPGLDGVAATRAIRALPDPAQSTVPIVALTADAFEETRERCLVAGMNDFLTKPVSPQKLQTSLRRLFGAAIAPGPEVPPAQPRPWDGQLQTLVDEGAIRMALEAMPPARLGQMIANFLDQGPETVERLRAAVRNGQPLDLRINAHAAKGAALNLGLAGLAATATALQEGAAHLPAVEIARLVQRYEAQLPLTRQALHALDLPGIPAPDAGRH